jgi:hypothetical protein
MLDASYFGDILNCFFSFGMSTEGNYTNRMIIAATAIMRWPSTNFH